MTIIVEASDAIAEAKSGTRSERVTIRPFEGIHDTESVLKSVHLLLGDASYEAGPVVVDDETLGKAALNLVLPEPDQLLQALKQTSVPAPTCALLVMGTSRTHRASTVLLKERLTKDASYPTELILNRADADLVLRDRAGFRITVAVVLLENIPPAPLKPNTAGTWLGRAVFNVSPEKQETSFSPEELTEEVRRANDLPEGVLRFITFDDLLGAEDLSDAVRVYVEPGVLRWMLNNESDPVAIQQQIELAIMAYDSTAQEIVREIRTEYKDPDRVLSESDVEPYPAAHRFFEHLAAKCRRSLTDVLRLASDGQRIRPHLEASFDATKHTLKALRD
jgi:hypothetical protein